MGKRKHIRIPSPREARIAADTHYYDMVKISKLSESFTHKPNYEMQPKGKAVAKDEANII